jgi:hypothetical protein
MWPFMREIVVAGETFSWATGTSGEDARAGWFPHGQEAGFTSRRHRRERRGAEELLALLRPSVRAVAASGMLPEISPTGLASSEHS